MREVLPPDASILGFMTYDEPETSLWRPFGSRRVLHVRIGESPESVRARGIKYVLVNEEKTREPLEQWLKRMNGRVLEAQDLKLRAGRPSGGWYLVELQPLDATRPN